MDVFGSGSLQQRDDVSNTTTHKDISFDSPISAGIPSFKYTVTRHSHQFIPLIHLLIDDSVCRDGPAAPRLANNIRQD
jgi:hypothetical protein